MNKLIFFDVDGVLVESSREIMLTSWNEYNQWLADIDLPHAPFTLCYGDIPNEFLVSRGELMKHTHKGYYRVALNMFTLAGLDPYKVDKALIQAVSEVDPLLKEATMARLAMVRQRLLAEGDISTLARGYNEVDYRWIEQKMSQGELYFVTNNAFSINSFAAVAFTPDETFVRRPEGAIHNKAEHINAICAERCVSHDRVLFIDDSLASLQDVDHGSAVPNENCLQNSWAEKRPSPDYQRLDWQAIVARYESL